MNVLGKYKGILYLFFLFFVVPFLCWEYCLSDIAKASIKTRKNNKLYTGYMMIPEDSQNHFPSPEISYENIISNGQILDILLDMLDKNNLVVTQYTPRINGRNGELILNTAEISVIGKYISIVKLINYLEEMELCQLVSVNMKTEKLRYIKETQLKCVLILQQISQSL